jgi:hypothetical protein
VTIVPNAAVGPDGVGADAGGLDVEVNEAHSAAELTAASLTDAG